MVFYLIDFAASKMLRVLTVVLMQYLAVARPRASGDPKGRHLTVLFFHNHLIAKISESLILAQSERWRRGLGMQVERYRKV